MIKAATIEPGRDDMPAAAPANAPAAPAVTDLRCSCGSLLARVLPTGVELKCRRCRRSVLVSLGADGRFTLSGDLIGPRGSTAARGRGNRGETRRC
jgi:hypothetical protein